MLLTGPPFCAGFWSFLIPCQFPPVPTSTPSATPTSSPAPTGTPHNPIRIAHRPHFIGNVTSINTPDDVRDLGYQGQIGDVWINTFGDTIPCKKAWPTQAGCFGIEASNSAGIPVNTTSFNTIDANKKHRTTSFCPRIDGEAPGFGLGLTNVVPTSSSAGIVYIYAINRDKNAHSPAGSGVGIITINHEGKPICSRPNGPMWQIHEPHYGDHSAVLGSDGYIYAYGGGRASDCPPAPKHCLNYLWLARVPQAQAANISAYEYWNGSEFSPERLYNPSSKSSVMYGGQGTVIYSPFYKKYMYFKPGE